MSDFSSYWWGRLPPSSARAAYCGRAIYLPRERRQLDILHDRISLRGTGKQMKDLVKGLKTLRRLVKEAHLDTDSHTVIYREVDGMIYEFSPQGSYGHMYFGMWLKGEGNDP